MTVSQVIAGRSKSARIQITIAKIIEKDVCEIWPKSWLNKRVNKCTCKFRYRQPDIDIEVEYLDNNTLKLSYNGSKAVTPGQFCVLYDGDICLGGGIIDEVFK